MAKIKKKPTHKPSGPFPTEAEALHQEGNWLWIPLRGKWRDVTNKPEEIVRQKFIRTLLEHYGYTLEQIDQERRTQYRTRSPRVDIVVWKSAEDKAKNTSPSPAIIVECKTDTIDIQERDYYQGESYSRATECEFLVATNNRHTAIFRLISGFPGEFFAINEIPKASDWGDAKRLKEIRESLRTFNRKEFQDLLFVCHSILRDVHKMDPGRAFDTISKILFIKMYVERSGLHGTFTTEYLDRRAASRMPNDPLVHDGLFELTKDDYKADDIFAASDKLDISEATFRRIVKQLERFDLSKTGDDIKGLAFEKFLGTTFRGKLGQFFTPRPVVDFMVELLNPLESQLICDPAAGSGGFLIRAFEHVRAEHFKAALQCKASGTSGRKRVTPDGFLSLMIPVPTLAEQDTLVADYSAALIRAVQLEHEAEAIEHAAWKDFETALGVSAPPPLPVRSVFIARFKDLERWSHEGILRSTVDGPCVQVATCPVVELGKVATVSYGLQKSPANRPGLHARPYLRVANVQRGRLVLDEIKTINVLDSDMPALKLEVGDILFFEGNGSWAELGRVALWNGEIDNCVHQNHIIKARSDKNQLMPEFAMAWFNSDAGRDHFFKSGKTTSGLGTINSTVIRTAPIPLPSPSFLVNN